MWHIAEVKRDNHMLIRCILNFTTRFDIATGNITKLVFNKIKPKQI